MNQTERAFAEIRRQRGYSRPCAAALLRVSTAHLGRLEKGRLPLSLGLAERMGTLYDVDLNALTRPVVGVGG